MVRLLRRFFLVLLLLGLLSHGLGTAASAGASSVNIAHTAVDEVAAGDAMQLPIEVTTQCGIPTGCGQLEVTVSYGKPAGALTTARKLGSRVLYGGAKRANFTFEIPGDAVRFPEVAYRISARMGEIASASLPSAGAFVVPVQNVLRARFVKPDGSPAANVLVSATPTTGGRVWTTFTDAAGAARLELPSDDSFLTQRQAGDGYANLVITAIDGWPTEPSQPGESRTVEGLIADVGAFVNLGAPDVESVDTQVQDHVFPMRSESMSYSAAADSEQCYSTDYSVSCTERTYPSAIYNVDLPVANRIGGGLQMESTFRYETSNHTTTSILVKADGGWVEANGEVLAETAHSASVSTDWKGPNENVTQILSWRFAQDHTETCIFFFCRTSDRVVPDKWTGGNFREVSADKHDDAENAGTGDDCTVRSEGLVKSSTKTGEKLAFSLGGSYGILHARTKFSDKTDKVVQQQWRIWPSATGSYFHHLFVDEGMKSGNPHCPPMEYPTLIWTDTSSIDKTNPARPGGLHLPGEVGSPV